MRRHVPKWGLVCLLLASSAVLAGDDDRVAQVERDIASIDTRVRMHALSAASVLKDRDAQRRIFMKLAHDPDPEIRSLALEFGLHGARGPEAAALFLHALDDPDKKVRKASGRALSRLSLEDMRCFAVDQFTARVPAAATSSDENELGWILSLIQRQFEAGVAVSATSVVAIALDARSGLGRAPAFDYALWTTRIAPLSSNCVPVLTRLLADKATRERTIDFLGHARGAVGFGFLLEIEATTTSDSERELVQRRIEHHDGHAKELHRALLDAAQNARDPRVRELAKRRLEDW